jgi:hypothetical protein
MKKIICLLTVIIFLASSGQGHNITTTNADSDWAIMFYFNGDNQLSDVMQNDINIIKNVGATEDVRFAILSDSDEIGDTKLYYVEGTTLVEQDWPTESDMGDPDTIVDFIQKIKTDYPASNYCFIPYSNKGAGWQGLIYDQNGDGTMITMPELKNVFSTVTNNGADKIDVFFAESCLCGNLELRYQIRDYVDYTVGYADCGLTGDIPYNEILIELVGNPSMSAADFATLIVDLFEPADYPFYDILQSMGAAQSDTLDELAASIDDLALLFIQNIEEYNEDITIAWEESRIYGPTWDIDYYRDLQHFLELMTINDQEFIDTKNRVISKIETAMIAIAVLEKDNSAGFNFYFPGRKADYNLALRYDDGVLPSEYEETQFAIDTNWDEFLAIFLDLEGNTAPEAPTINGEARGTPGTEYEYTITTTDAEEDTLYYYIDWGDGTNSGWIGPYDSGEEITVEHTWEEEGTYTVRVKARDSEESDWGTLTVKMPKTKSILTLNRGEFTAEIGLAGEEEPRIFLNGNHRSRWRFLTVFGIATNGEQGITFQGFFRGTSFVLQIPLRGRIANIVGRCTFDENRDFEGNWKLRGFFRANVNGWIRGTIN